MGKASNLMKAHKKIQEQQEKERRLKAEAFLEAYRKLVQDTGIEWTCELEFTPKAVSPRLRLAEARPPQGEVKSWADAKRENLENRKACPHEKRTDDVRDCNKCGLPEKFWGENDTGATQDYIERTEQKIKEIDEADKRREDMEKEEDEASREQPKEEERTEEKAEEKIQQ